MLCLAVPDAELCCAGLGISCLTLCCAVHCLLRCSDGQLITGQNPGSSKAVAAAVIAALLPPLAEPVHGKGEGFHHRQV